MQLTVAACLPTSSTMAMATLCELSSSLSSAPKSRLPLHWEEKEKISQQSSGCRCPTDKDLKDTTQ